MAVRRVSNENCVKLTSFFMISRIWKISRLQKNQKKTSSNLRLQNGTNVDHVRLQAQLQRYFEKVLYKNFLRPLADNLQRQPPNFGESCNSIPGECQEARMKNFASFLSY